MRPASAVLLAGALFLAVAAWGEAPPAAGAVRLFEALEGAPASIVAKVGAPRRIDAESWMAEFRVEQSLVGGFEVGRVIGVVWEERVPRPVRFDEGDRILVSLEALPGGSIWRHRFPDWEERSRLLFMANQGGAFLREPSSGSTLILEHYLALPADLRERNAGVGYLVRLAEGARLTLASAAVDRLAEVVHLDRELDPTSAGRLVAALLRDDADDGFRQAVLVAVERRKLESLRPTLDALTAAEAEALAPAAAFEALGRIDAGLPATMAARLLALEERSEHRRVGAGSATDPTAAELPRIMRLDPASAVRAAAVTRWVELRGVDGVDRALDAFADPERDVEAAAAAAIGSLGPEAVPALRGVVEVGPAHASRAAVAALRVAGGSEAYAALVEIAANHPDESVRVLAKAAVGQPIGHVD